MRDGTVVPISHTIINMAGGIGVGGVVQVPGKIDDQGGGRGRKTDICDIISQVIVSFSS